MSYKNYTKADYYLFVPFNKKKKLPSKTLAHFQKVEDDEPLEIQNQVTNLERIKWEFCQSCLLYMV